MPSWHSGLEHPTTNGISYLLVQAGRDILRTYKPNLSARTKNSLDFRDRIRANRRVLKMYYINRSITKRQTLAVKRNVIRNRPSGGTGRSRDPEGIDIESVCVTAFAPNVDHNSFWVKSSSQPLVSNLRDSATKRAEICSE